MKTFRLGSQFATTNAMGVSVQGLSRYAQARLDNSVSRQVRKHQEALKVDNIGLYIWLRRMGGLVCTCRQPAKPIASEQQLPDQDNLTPDQLRQPRQESTELPIAGEDGPVSFKVMHMRGQPHNPLPNPPVPTDFAGVNNLNNNGIDGSQKYDGLNSLAPLDEASNDLTDDELAIAMSEGGGLFGGDSTACGICFGTGRTHGYELATGQRMILDASNEWLFNFSGNATIDYSQFPAQFMLDSRADSAIIWTVDLPTFTNGWLVVAVRNNLEPANNLIVQWQHNGSWQTITPAILGATDGVDRRATQIRVVNDGGVGLGDNLCFTHVEIIYSTSPPIAAATAPINITTNFDVSQPVITAEFEVMAQLDSLPRESIFVDTKYHMVWKIVDSLAKFTSTGQMFAFTINARSVHTSEMAYALKLLTEPSVTVNYRGLERTEGNLYQEYWPDSINVPNSMTFPEENADLYPTEES